MEANYVQKIPCDKLDEGITLCLTNAERLLNDARLLHENGRHPSGIVLAMYSWEEVAKAWFILSCKEETKNITLNQWRRKAALHIWKLDNVQTLMNIHSSPIFPEDDWEVMLREQYGEKDHSVELKETRERATYVDFDFQKGQWVSPESRNVFGGDGEAYCTEVIRIAENCLSAVREEMQWTREAENRVESTDPQKTCLRLAEANLKKKWGYPERYTSWERMLE
jgi:AbiV family abortive infection protein